MEHIKGEIEESSSDYEREKLEERLAKLSDGVAVLKVRIANISCLSSLLKFNPTRLVDLVM